MSLDSSISLDAEPIELDLQAPSSSPPRRTKWPLIGVAIAALVAVGIGHAQRPAPPKLGTVVRATGIDQCSVGADTIVELDVVNQLDQPITLSSANFGARTMHSAFEPEGENAPCRPGWSWPSSAQPLRLAPDDLGVVYFAYSAVCAPARPELSSVKLTIDVAGRKIVRDVTPGSDTLASMNIESYGVGHMTNC
jgi:hypothetical protein